MQHACGLVGEDLLGLVDFGPLERLESLDLSPRQLREDGRCAGSGPRRRYVGVVGVAPELPRLQTDALPRVQLSEAEAGEGVTLIDLFIRLEFAKSKSEVRRLVKGGGARLNGEKVEDAELMVSAASFEGDAKELKLSAGKKKHGMVVME